MCATEEEKSLGGGVGELGLTVCSWTFLKYVFSKLACREHACVR